jgi:hypothetical protein
MTEIASPILAVEERLRVCAGAVEKIVMKIGVKGSQRQLEVSVQKAQDRYSSMAIKPLRESMLYPANLVVLQCSTLTLWHLQGVRPVLRICMVHGIRLRFRMRDTYRH